MERERKRKEEEERRLREEEEMKKRSVLHIVLTWASFAVHILC